MINNNRVYQQEEPAFDEQCDCGNHTGCDRDLLKGMCEPQQPARSNSVSGFLNEQQMIMDALEKQISQLEHQLGPILRDCSIEKQPGVESLGPECQITMELQERNFQLVRLNDEIQSIRQRLEL